MRVHIPEQIGNEVFHFPVSKHSTSLEPCSTNGSWQLNSNFSPDFTLSLDGGNPVTLRGVCVSPTSQGIPEENLKIFKND